MGLEIHDVSKSFGDFLAVDDVSFTVQPGRIFGFLGTNGAGKTTTMRMILDIYRPDAGTITWNGTSNRDIPRREFGYLPEECGLYPKMRVQIIREIVAPKQPKQASKAAREVLKILDLIKPGEVAKVTAEEGQSVRGLKVSFGRVASNHGRKIQTWSVPDEPDVLYIKPIL